MQTTLRKRWTFDAAHQLPNHDGKCARLHGHTYTVEVSVTGTVRNGPEHRGLPDEGMVIDFARLSAIWKATLEPLLDHQNLNDTIGERLPGPTTAENIALWIFAQFVGSLAGTGVQASEVTVWETPTGSATVRAAA